MAEWLGVGNALQIDKRLGQPNAWVWLRVDGNTFSLSPLQARETAALLNAAANAAEKQCDGTLVTVGEESC